jgi:hypothetical protein
MVDLPCDAPISRCSALQLDKEKGHARTTTWQFTTETCKHPQLNHFENV